MRASGVSRKNAPAERRSRKGVRRAAQPPAGAPNAPRRLRTARTESTRAPEGAHRRERRAGERSRRRAPRSQTSSTAQASTRSDHRRPPPAAAGAEGGAPGGARGKGLDNGANVWYNVSTSRKEYVRSWGSKTAHTSYRPRPPRTSKQPARAIIQNAPFCLIAICWLA